MPMILPTRHARHALLALVAAVLLSACGNKGPLVLPEPPDPAGHDVPAPADDADDGEGDG